MDGFDALLKSRHPQGESIGINGAFFCQVIHQGPPLQSQTDAGDKQVSKTISTILCDSVKRIDDISFCLGHFAAISYPNQTMQEDDFKRALFGQLLAYHNHPNHPEEKDIITSLQARRGINRAESKFLSPLLECQPTVANCPSSTALSTLVPISAVLTNHWLLTSGSIFHCRAETVEHAAGAGRP